MILPRQIDMLLDFLEEHPELALGHVNRSAEARNLSTRLWQECANLLNSVSSDGAQKSWSMWRSFYADFKSRLIRRIKLNKQQLLGTGGGPNKKVHLSSQQERLLHLLGEDVGDPIPGVRHSPPQLYEQSATVVETQPMSRLDLISLSASPTTSSPNLLDSYQTTPVVEPVVGATPSEGVQSPRVIRCRTSRRRRPRRVDTSDTEDLYTIGFQKVASRFGKEFTFALKCKIMGQQSEEFAAAIINELELPLTVNEFLDETRAIFKELFPHCKVMPGVKKLINHLHSHKVPIGLATSSTIDTYNLKTVNHQDLFDLLPYKTWGSSDPLVKKGKPSPDIFIVAASKFPENPSKDKCLVFEDSINGVRAARAADMQVVLVPDQRLDRSLVPEATLIIDSIEQFRPEDFGLPPYDN